MYYKSRCDPNSVWNTMYNKLRCNTTQFVMYYKLRSYYKVQRNKAQVSYWHGAPFVVRPSVRRLS